jgi:hypothetical protein
MVVNLCLITKCVNKSFITSFVNWSLLFETIFNGPLNLMITWIMHLLFHNFFSNFALFQTLWVATIVNVEQPSLIVIGYDYSKSTPHFSKDSEANMLCKGMLIVDLFRIKLDIFYNFCKGFQRWYVM